ncbi:MAG: glycosyltransferase [Actinophytocola sp.]|uniref:glycosyltransferase n=1 Tax=Actinophytocola sp. TaxID=1872138 RepID=UPI003D6C5A58
MIGYYVHHQGRGHLHRARSVLSHVDSPSTVLSSLPGPWLVLPRDDDGPIVDPTAGGRFHWVPTHHAGLRRRMARIARWIEETAPALMVVDVSVEVAVLARSMGVPVLVTAMRGDRTDPAHELGYAVAHQLLAPWPAVFADPGWRWPAKTRYVGAFSRFDGRAPERSTSDRRRVVVLWGAGGTDIGAAAPGTATPGWEWDWLGGPGSWTQDPWPAISSADVVVSHAGQNAIAEVAAARRPAVVLPQQRPFGEQDATASALARAGLAVVHRAWPAPAEWPSVLAEAVALGGDRWVRWSPGDGARRAAQVIDELAGASCGSR